MFFRRRTSSLPNQIGSSTTSVVFSTRGDLLCHLTYVVVMARRAPSIVIDSEQRQTLEGIVRFPTLAQRDVLRASLSCWLPRGSETIRSSKPWESPNRSFWIGSNQSIHCYFNKKGEVFWKGQPLLVAGPRESPAQGKCGPRFLARSKQKCDNHWDARPTHRLCPGLDDHGRTSSAHCLC